MLVRAEFCVSARPHGERETDRQTDRQRVKCMVNNMVVNEPVWPSGKALGWKAEGLWFESASALLSFQKVVVCGHCLVILSLTVNET